MRSFEQRKEEIFALSQKRIKARKTTRKYILAIAIPLFVCVTALSVIIIQSQKSKSYTYSNSGYECDEMENIADSINLSYVNIVADSKEVKNYTADTDNSKVFEISNILNSFFEQDNDELPEDAGLTSSQSATTAKGENNTNTKGDSASKTHKYEIETIYDNGVKVVYILDDYRLTNSNTGQTVTLDKNNLDKLLKKLGVWEGE